MSLGQQTARWLALAGTAITLTLGIGVVPAGAAETDLLLSHDGVTFAPTLDGGLFDQFGLLVPGESKTAGLWLRNPTGNSANLRVTAQNVVIPSSAYSGGIAVSTWDSLTGTTATGDLGTVAACEVLLSTQVVPPGGTVRMAVTFTMGDLTGTQGQGESAGMDLMVAMRDAEAGPFPDSACEDHGVLIRAAGRSSTTGAVTEPGGLASTGGELPASVLAAAAILIGIGSALIAGRRRTKGSVGSC